MSTLLVDFAGEIHQVQPGEEFTIGRCGNLVIDNNPYLHRNFLAIRHDGKIWWIHNVGSRIPARLSDVNRLIESTLTPGSAMPLVFESMLLTFHAGNTSYELEISLASAVYQTVVISEDNGGGDDAGGDPVHALSAFGDPRPRGTGAATRGSWCLADSISRRGRPAPGMDADPVQPETRQRVRQARQGRGTWTPRRADLPGSLPSRQPGGLGRQFSPGHR